MNLDYFRSVVTTANLTLAIILLAVALLIYSQTQITKKNKRVKKSKK